MGCKKVAVLMRISWEEGEGINVSGAYGGEVAPVDGGDLLDPQPFGGGHDRGVDGTYRQLPVAHDQLSDAQPVRRRDGLDGERAASEVPEEADLRVCPESSRQEVRHLGDDQGRDNERPGMGFEKFQRGRVVRIVGIDVGVERTGVDDDRGYRPTSAARISSMRSETSLLPLRPAAAAPSRRRSEGPPR